MSGLSNMAVAIVIIALAIVVLKRWIENAKCLPLPPGPPTLPLVGNLFDLSQGAPWTAFSAMSQKYGDIMHLKAMNQHIVVISSVEAAADLFEQRATIYSDRYQSVMLAELMDIGWSFASMNYGEEWRKKRKIFHQELGANAIRDYDAQQLGIVREFLKRLYSAPDKFFEHARFIFAAILMDIIYGIRIEDVTNKHVREAENWGLGFNQAIEPGRFWVDFIPILKYIPESFPGATFKKLVAGWRRNMYNACDGPFNEAKYAYSIGLATRCAVTNILGHASESDDGEEEERLARHAFGIAFGAGVDTVSKELGAASATLTALLNQSAPTTQIFFYLMMTHPEIQKKAQAQLEAVVGPDRLPTLDDRVRLPYVEAILKETMRWSPVTPLALPHYTSSSDEYRGYYIPKDSIVIGNAWHILHDPIQYPDPHEFKPERYLNPDGTLNTGVSDPDMVFGFGRRICPGRFLALNMMFLVMAGTIHLFDIKPPLGADGKPAEVAEMRLHEDAICHPEEFPCLIQIRNSFADGLTG